MRSIFIIICCISIFSACKENAEKPDTGISEESLRRYISTLSSDEFLGRKPFTEGETKTLSFLEEEIKRIGLTPGNGTSFYQDVPLVEIDGKPSDTLELKGPKPLLLQLGKDFVAYTPHSKHQAISIEASELVFCGYGIVAPELGWDDYAGIDMKGKTALVLVNDPGLGSEDSTFFKGDEMMYYGRWTYKYEEAARQGAAGVLIVHETTMAGYPYAVVQGASNGAKLHLENLGYTPCSVLGWVSLDAAKEIFSNAGQDLQSVMQAARKPGFKALPLPYTVNMTIETKVKSDVSKNVIAIIPGKETPDEYIIFSAHWDHLGIGAMVDGDSIYNGAVDNASGIAALLAIAEALMNSGENKRTVVFLWVTAEEQGLLGSAYYAANPIFPPEKTVANLNIDAMYALGPMKDFSLFGYGQSEMEDYATRWAEKQGRYVRADPEPEKGYFYRSDHFNFAKIGIPALYGKASAEHMEKGKEFAVSQVTDYITIRYHQPGDEYTESFEVGTIIQDAELYLNIVKELANNGAWPKWKATSEFKPIRDKSRPEN
ncbi:MAG: M20/M25/M40 family metallo-hydrolase [Saprospiraceae bacterium]